MGMFGAPAISELRVRRSLDKLTVKIFLYLRWNLSGMGELFWMLSAAQHAPRNSYTRARIRWETRWLEWKRCVNSTRKLFISDEPQDFIFLRKGGIPELPLTLKSFIFDSKVGMLFFMFN